MDKIFADNEVIVISDEFYISYTKERTEFAKMCDDILHAAGRPEPQDRDETALVIRGEGSDQNRYLILYGDHREAYKNLVPDLNACLTYFNSNIHLIGHSSDTPKETYQ